MDLDGFKAWILARGRDEGTATLYTNDVRLAYESPNPPLGRLSDKRLSAHTRRHTMAALRAWSVYTEDAALLKKLADVILPPAVRQTPRPPLARAEWDLIAEGARQAVDLDESLRAIIGLIAERGMRIGDVLRMRKQEIKRALALDILSIELKRGRRAEFGAELIRDHLEVLARVPGGWERVEDFVSPGAAPDRRRKSAEIRIWRWLKRLAEDVGLDPKMVYPHRLRRTYSIEFLEEVGGDLNKLKDHMQWSNIQTAALYVDHGRRIELDKAAARMRKRKG